MGMGDQDGGEIRQSQPQCPKSRLNAAAGDPGVHQQVDIPAGEHQCVSGRSAGKGVYSSGQNHTSFHKMKAPTWEAADESRHPPSRTQNNACIIIHLLLPLHHGAEGCAVGVRFQDGLPKAASKTPDTLAGGKSFPIFNPSFPLGKRTRLRGDSFPPLHGSNSLEKRTAESYRHRSRE